VGTWVLDLDGVVWRGDVPVSGAAEATAALVASGHELVFCTNHAMSASAKRDRLDRLGVAAGPVVTSGEAAAGSCEVGERVLVLGDSTLVATFEEFGHDVTDVFELPDDGPAPPCDVVVVGAVPSWDRSRIGLAADGVRTGARLLATNADPTFPSSGAAGPRVLPGNGALVAAISTATGVTAEVAGKPYAPTVDLLRSRHGSIEVVVGDKAETDGALAVALGARFALVLSGVTTEADLPVSPVPDVVAADLGALVASLHR
jgi:glycerol-1-phosphatase